jgi:hypothetical protein
MSKATPEQRKRASFASIGDSRNPKLTMGDVRKIVQHPIQFFLPAAMRAEIPILMQMQSAFLIAPSGSEFITSDNPVARYDPEMSARPILYRTPDLRFPTVEVTLPLSPKITLSVTHGLAPRPGIKPVVYIDVSASDVKMMNIRTAIFSNEFIVSSRNEVDPSLFVGPLKDPGD